MNNQKRQTGSNAGKAMYGVPDPQPEANHATPEKHRESAPCHPCPEPCAQQASKKVAISKRQKLAAMDPELRGASRRDS